MKILHGIEKKTQQVEDRIETVYIDFYHELLPEQIEIVLLHPLYLTSEGYDKKSVVFFPELEWEDRYEDFLEIYPIEETIELFPKPFKLNSVKNTQKVLYDIGLQIIWKLVEKKIKPTYIETKISEYEEFFNKEDDFQISKYSFEQDENLKLLIVNKENMKIVEEIDENDVIFKC